MWQNLLIIADSYGLTLPQFTMFQSAGFLFSHPATLFVFFLEEILGKKSLLSKDKYFCSFHFYSLGHRTVYGR